MNDDAHKIVQDLLNDIFSNVNNWLTHAETKNAALVAFNVACLSFIWDMKINADAKILYYIVCVGMLLSTILALISFFPKTSKETRDQRRHSDLDNLIFYADICRYNKEQYIKAIFKQYAKNDILDTEIQKIEKDFAEEITYNAAVVVRKYKWFNYALKTEILMLVVLVITLIVA